MLCCHFVSRKSLSQIKKCGFLKPNTPLVSISDLTVNIKVLREKYGMNREKCNEIRNFARRFPIGKFICVIPKHRIRSWISSGLMEEINHFIKPQYVLEFEVPKNSKLFAREHIYQSPREIKKKFPTKMYRNTPEPYKTLAWLKYFMSTRKVKDNLDLRKIKVPELWIQSKIPVSKITITQNNTPTDPR